MNRRHWALVVLVGAVTIPIVSAVPTVRAEPLATVDGQPVNVAADHVVVDLQQGTALLTGNVRMEKGDLVVRCGRVEARYDEAPNITWARAVGDVTADWKGARARAREAQLTVSSRALVLRGEVKLSRGGAWIEAQEAQVDFKTGRITMEQVSGSIPVSSSQAQPMARDAAP